MNVKLLINLEPCGNFKITLIVNFKFMGGVLETLCWRDSFKYVPLNSDELDLSLDLSLELDSKVSMNLLSSESLFIVNGIKTDLFNNERSLIIPELFITLGEFAMKIEELALMKGTVYNLISSNHSGKSGKSVFCKILAGILKPDNCEFFPNFEIAYKPQYICRCKYTGTVYNFIKYYLKEFQHNMIFKKENGNHFGNHFENDIENGDNGNIDIEHLESPKDRFESFKKLFLIPFDILHIYNKKIQELSEYEWVILSIVSTIINFSPDIYLIDEYVWLTRQERDKIAKILKEFAKKFNKIIIMVETDRTVYLDNYDNFIKIVNKGDLQVVTQK